MGSTDRSPRASRFRYLLSPEVLAQCAEPLTPERLVAADPVGDFAKRLRALAVVSEPSAHLDLDEPRVAEHPEVLREGRLRERDPGRELSCRQRPPAQPVEHRPPRRVGDRKKAVAVGGYS